MKRGGGTVNRGGSERRGGDLGSRKTSGTATNRSTVTTSRPTFRSPGSDSTTTRAADDAIATTGTTSATADASTEPEAASTDGEEAEEVVDYGARTLGKSCMYGTRGEVIFRPRGAACRGDAQPAAPAARAARARPGNPRRVGGAQAPAARSDTPNATVVRPAARRSPSKPSGSRASKPSGSRGSCIFGGDGRVVYAPPGADCRR